MFVFSWYFIQCIILTIIFVGFEILQRLFQTAGHSRRSTKYNSTFKVSTGQIGFNPGSQKVMHDFLLYGQIVEDTLLRALFCSRKKNYSTLILKKISGFISVKI
jgi:hypothetical protein